MDIGAELTLQIARLVHEGADPPRSPAFWSFLPDVSRASWPEARAILSAAPKPLLVGPLIEPGSLGLWTLDRLEDKARSVMSREMANQVAYFTEKLRVCEVGDGGRIRFEPSTLELSLTVPDFLHWTREYSMTVGLSLVKGPQPGVARLIVRPPGGGGPPLGAEPATWAPAS
jgi:hypothetical protein